MVVNTSRFGAVDVDEHRVITFEKGLLGFAEHTEYALLQPTDDEYFYWLQSLDDPDLAFVVTDPSLFISDYQVALKHEQLAELGLDTLDDAQVMVIVNKRGEWLTGNLLGPLVIHSTQRTGRQIVLADRRYDTRVPLVELTAGGAAASA